MKYMWISEEIKVEREKRKKREFNNIAEVKLFNYPRVKK